jgi:hypothetical protein
MTDPYPNNSANTIYDHFRSVSNIISDLGESITSFQFSTTLSEPTDLDMPSFTRPGSIRRRFLRIISFGRYSDGSADDLEPLTKTQDSSRRYNAPAHIQSTDRPVYTVHQSAQSLDSAQTTIIHEVPSGAVPFSINTFRDQYHSDYISDTEFDTPPSLEIAQQPTHPDGATRPTAPTHLLPENIGQHSTRPRRNKSFMQCNVCNRNLEYTQIHCPGCAARTLHHVPGSLEDSYTDSNNHDTESRPLQPRKRRQNQQHDIPTEENSWDTQGLEAGTAEESWTTTTAEGVDPVSPERSQESSLQFGVSEGKQAQGEILRKACRCCCKRGVAIVHHCCCASSTSATAEGSCTQPCCLRGCPVIAAVVCGGSAHHDHASKCWKRGIRHRHICYKMSVAEYARAIEASDQGCICRGEEGEEEVAEETTAWWMRCGKWFCCC